MQTFLPYESFAESARVLDNRRLGKQRVEVIQILNALERTDTKGWVNHPVTKMWRGYEGCLIAYGVAVCDEWIRRGFRDTCREKLLARLGDRGDQCPPWLGIVAYHSSHRANLLRKDPVFYGRFGWTESPDEPYYWPT